MTKNNDRTRTWEGNKRYILEFVCTDASPEQADKIYAIFDEAFDKVLPLLNDDQNAQFGEITPTPSGDGWWSARKLDKVIEEIH